MIQAISHSVITKKISYQYLATTLLLFIALPPIIGLPMVICNIWNKSNASKVDYIRYFCYIALYLGAINATKHPGGDQINYYFAYMNVPNGGLINSLIYIYGNTIGTKGLGISGEFMNGIYNYIGYYLTLGYYPLFICLFTFTMYMLIFMGLFYFAQTVKNTHKTIVCGVLIVSFFYMMFSLNIQLQKQNMAEAIMLYVMGRYTYDKQMKKKNWLMVATAVFTHQSMIFFVPFLVWKKLQKKLHKETMIVLGVMIVLMIMIAPKFADSISSGDSNVLTHGASRLAKAEKEDDGLSIKPIHMFFIGLPIFYILFRKMWLGRKKLSNEGAFMLNVSLFLILSILGMYKMPLMQYRYFLMLPFFFPFIYPFFSDNVKIRNRFLTVMSCVIVGTFFLMFSKLIWNYASEIAILLEPPIFLIFFDTWPFKWDFGEHYF